MLAGHPALSSPPELHLLPFKTMREREKEIGISHLGKGLQRAFMEFKNIDARESQQLIDNLVKENLSIEEVYRLLQQLSGDRLLVDKSPTYASSRETLERAEALFDKPKYIHLVRHPYAVIESFVRMRMDKLIGSTEANPYQLAESIWTTSNQNILDLGAEIDSDRHYLVKYEELVSNPERVMRDLCEFLGIAFDPAVLAPYQGDRMTDGAHHASMSLGDPNFLNHRQIDAQLGETWRTIKLPSLLSPDTQTVARNLNYELPQEAEFLELSPTLSMQEISIDIRGLRLCLCSWGPEEGPLVLCLHGILEQGAAWSEVAIRLAQSGYRVIAPDLRGHGRSDRVGKGGSYNLLDFLADIDAIVENLADKAFTLVGHSLGSVVAAIFASIRPQRIKNLVLVETILPAEVEDEEAANQLATHLDYLANPPEHPVFPDVEAAAERLRQGTPAISKSLAMLLAERITEPCDGGVRWRWAPILRTRAGVGFNGIGRSRYLGLLKRIKVPITLVYGDKSSFNRQEDLAAQQAAMPHAEKVVVSGGHNLPLETPSALAKIISGAIALTTKTINSRFRY
jgi:pimeloyl-ACP methyl ester carboxylesterase